MSNDAKTPSYTAVYRLRTRTVWGRLPSPPLAGRSGRCRRSQGQALAAQPHRELEVTLAQVLPVDRRALVGEGLGESALARLQALGADAVEDAVRSVRPEELEVHDPLFIQAHALLHYERVPVGGPRLGVEAPVVVLGQPSCQNM